MIEKTFKVRGMSCASCSDIIAKYIRNIDGVTKIDVNFATEKANVTFDNANVSVSDMNTHINKLGYSLEDTNDMAGMDHTKMSADEMIDHSIHTGIGQSKEQKQRELEELESRTYFVLPISIMVFILMIWDISSKTLSFVPNLPIPMELFNTINVVLATLILFWIGQPFLKGVLRFVQYRVANMDTLIGLGTFVAYIYSLVITLLPQIRTSLGLPEYTYFDVTIVVIGFVIFGKYLEARSKIKTGEAIEKLIGLQAKTALLWKDRVEVEVNISDVKIGDTLIVKPGAKIPVDGKIVEGETSIDESMISGESVPVDKMIGDIVIGSTINKQGNIKFVATKVGKETVLSQIIRMVENAQGSKAPIQEMADKISSVFVPIVLGISILSFLSWVLIGVNYLPLSTALSYGLLSFVGVLVIACPCALGLATPTAIIVGVGKGAEYGILIKSAEALEKLSHVDVVVMDKTGTITKGKPEVSDVVRIDDIWTEEKIIQLVASIEKLSEHPLAEAIVRRSVEFKLKLSAVENFKALEGVGVKGIVDGKEIYVRKPNEIDNRNLKISALEEQGKTVIVLEFEGVVVGVIALSDTIKEESYGAIQKLHKRGVKVIMLTGDNLLAAKDIAKQAGVDDVIAGVMPAEKVGKIKELQSAGHVVAMVGDGVNDAPSLVQADVGIAMATGTDVAIESAGITLLNGDMSKLSQSFELARATMRTVKQNLFWAFIYNIVGIPIAAGLLYPAWGIILNPIFAGIAMAGSSVSVVVNSLRLKTKKL